MGLLVVVESGGEWRQIGLLFSFVGRLGFPLLGVRSFCLALGEHTEYCGLDPVG